MPRGKKGARGAGVGRDAGKPIVAVMLPIIPAYNTRHYGAEGDEGERTLANMIPEHRDILSLAESHKKVAAAECKKSRTELFPSVLYLGANGTDDSFYRDRDIRKIADRLVNAGSEIKIVAHGNPNEIGTKTSFNMDPENLAEFFTYVLPEERAVDMQFTVDLQTCNSGHYKENAMESFAGRFWTAMHEAGFTGVSVKGYRGFTGEIDGKNRTYVTAKEGDTRNLIRSSEVQLVINADGTITPPKRSIDVEITRTHRDAVFEQMQEDARRTAEKHEESRKQLVGSGEWQERIDKERSAAKGNTPKTPGGIN